MGFGNETTSTRPLGFESETRLGGAMLFVVPGPASTMTTPLVATPFSVTWKSTLPMNRPLTSVPDAVLKKSSEVAPGAKLFGARGASVAWVQGDAMKERASAGRILIIFIIVRFHEGIIELP